MADLAGKTLFITGASRGIGEGRDRRALSNGAEQAAEPFEPGGLPLALGL